MANSLLKLMLTALLLTAAVAQAQIYKWTDSDGVVHYSQSPPASGQAEIIDAPPPPAIDPVKAQEEIDQLIEQQQKADAIKHGEMQAREKALQQQQIRSQNCEKAKQNLQSYQNNSGRRFVDAEGNVTRLPEEERQRLIKESQDKVQQYCQ
jgi:hypothetical protein